MDRDLRVSRRTAAANRGRVAVGTAAASLLCLLTATAVHAAPPDMPATDAYTVNGPVRAIAHAGGRTYIGGDFTRVGRRTGSGAVLSSNGARQTFPEVAGGDVHASVSDQAGGWYIGGTFTSVGGQPHGGLAHVNGDGTVDGGFNPRVTNFFDKPGEVNALVLSRPGPTGVRTLYVGGEFELIGVGDTEPHRNLAALNAVDGSPQSFSLGTACPDSDLPGCAPTVHSLALTYVPLPVTGKTPNPDQPILFVGGSFLKIGSGSIGTMAPTEGLSAAWGVGSVDGTNHANAGKLVEIQYNPTATWTPHVTDPNHGASVYTLQLGPVTFPDSATVAMAVYAGGWNWTSGDLGRKPMARAFQFTIKDMLGRKVGGAATFGGWNPSPGGCVECAVRALALSGSTLYIGGEFTTVGSAVPAKYLATIAAVATPSDLSSAATASPAPLAVDAPVRSLTASANNASTLLAGGDFTGGMLSFDSTSGALSPGWTSPDPDSSVRAIAADASMSSLYAGGDFRSLASKAHRGLAAFDASGQLLDSWAPTVGSAADAGSPGVDALAATDSVVYVGGHFEGGLAAVDTSSGAPIGTFAPSPSKASGRPDVLALSLVGSTLYAGGAFDQIGGQARSNLAAVDAGTGTADSAWKSDVRGSFVHAILPACGAVYVGGEFDQVGGQDRSNIAAVDLATGATTTWDPQASGTVLALARRSADIYVGGRFARVGGAEMQKVAAVDASTGVARDSFNASINPVPVGTEVRGLAVSDSALYLGGVFAPLGAGDAARANLAAVSLDSGSPTGWSAPVDGPVDTLSVAGDALYAGGAFGSVGTAGQRGLGAFGPGAGSSAVGGSCASQRTVESFGGLTPGGQTVPSGPRVVVPRHTVRSPAITQMTVKVSRLRSGRRSLIVSFRLARAGLVRLIFERGRRGRFVRLAQTTAHGQRGLNTFSFPGLRVGRRVLGRGRYRVRAILTAPRAVNGAGQTAFFTVR